MSTATRSVIIFPLALLSILALLTFWINKVVQPPAPKLDGSGRHDPDYIVNNFVTTQTNLQGDLRYKLAAVEMKHFPDDDTTNLQRPRYTQFAVGKPYTQVEGLRGHVSGDGKVVELVDNVKITRQAFAGNGEMTVDTDYLNILPDEELVRTPNPVVIRQAPKTIIYATGMLYEKKKQTLTLLHKVRAHYENPTTKTMATKTTSKVMPSHPTTLVKPKSLADSTTASPNQATTIQPSTPPDTNNARIRRRYE